MTRARDLDDWNGSDPAASDLARVTLGEPDATPALSGIEKAALLLLTIGPDDAAGVLRHLDTADVIRLGRTMASMPTCPRALAAELLAELHAHLEHGPSIYADAAQIREMFAKALGKERASHLIEHFMPSGGAASIRNLKWIDALDATELIKNEHPQIIATILAHLEPEHAAKILHHLPTRLRGDVILRVATLDGVRPAALKELDEALTRILEGSMASTKTSGRGGIPTAAEILKYVDAEEEEDILARVREYDPALANRLVLLFDHLAEVDDRGMQILVRAIDSERLIIALKGAAPPLRERFFVNMSSDAAEILREELDLRGPVRLSEVEAAQREILGIARRLADENRILLPSTSGEGYV
ncbi:MAG: flagellar motor switch protein FliG [Sphingobacteriia bacterium]|nr:flagellar motor switch protein FliG [Sphingobacteriia bacterium]NCC41142.1 flagellar motor switch protein FliG [Gammaproteobacteria bacterium]